MKPDWCETLPEGGEVRMAFLSVDLAGSSKGTGEERAAFQKTVEGVLGEFKGALLGWHGEGSMGFFYDAEGWPEVAAFRAALQIRERLVSRHGLTSHMAVHSAQVAFRKDLGRDVQHPELNKAGHMGGIAPASMVLLSADVAEALPDDLRNQVAYYGTTRRDHVPCFCWPKHPGTGPDPAHFLPATEDLWPIRCRYLEHLRGWTRYVQLVGIRQIRKMPAPEILAIFEPPSLARLEEEAGRLAGPSEVDQKLPAWARWRPMEPISLREALARHRTLALVGEPGAGKTTVLRYVAHVAAAGRRVAGERAHELQGLVPILAPAGALQSHLRQGRSLLDAVAAFWESEGVTGCGKFFEQALSDGRALLLMDALDELANADDRIEMARRVGQFAALRPQLRLVVTSRRVGFHALVLGLGEVFELKPLSDKQTDRLARAWFIEFEKLQGPEDPGATRRGEQEAKGFLADVRTSSPLGDLLRNPFMLTMACLIHRQGGTLPRHRVELYQLIGQTLMETWDAVRSLGYRPVGSRRDFRREARDVLGPLARHLHSNLPSGVIAEDQLLKFFDERMEKLGTPVQEALAAARKFLDELRKSTHLLVERGPEEWGFMHQTFQEFFTAQDIVAGERFTEEVAARVYDPRWREVIRLMAGILGVLQGRMQAVTQLIDCILSEKDSLRGELLCHNVFLAADSLLDAGGAEPDLVRTLVQLLTDLALRSEFQNLRQRAAKQLGALFDIVGIQAFTGMEPELQSPKPESRRAATEALGEAGRGRPEVLPALRARLEDSQPEVRSAAVNSLRWAAKGGSDIRQALLARLEDTEPEVRFAAVWSLGMAPQPSSDIIQAILPKLDDGPLVSTIAAWVVGLAGHAMPNVVTGLLARLEDPKPGLRLAATRALGLAGLGQPKVIEALLERRKDKEPKVRESAVEALALSAQPEAMRATLASLQDEDPTVRAAAARALGWARGQPLVIQALLARLEDAEPEVRFAAAATLAWAGEGLPEIIPALLARLEDAEPKVRSAAVGTLAQAGEGHPEVIPALQRALKDQEGRVRLAAAEGLVKLGAAGMESATVLEHLLKSPNREYHDRAFSALDRLATKLPPPALNLPQATNAT